MGLKSGKSLMGRGGARKGAGRKPGPQKPAEERRSIRFLGFMLTPAEKERIDEKARRAGLSAYLWARKKLLSTCDSCKQSCPFRMSLENNDIPDSPALGKWIEKGLDLTEGSEH